jgi:hypothetical protein
VKSWACTGQRIRTVTGYLDEISAMIRARFASSPLAAQLDEEIREFTAAGVTAATGS